ncbi:hypothetical protein CHUAL_000026 [Chamberlinius hualienensis]
MEILCCDFSDDLTWMCGTDSIPLIDSLTNGFGDIFDELGSLQLKILDVVDTACRFNDRISEANLILDNVFCSPAASLFDSVNTYVLNITRSNPSGLTGAIKLTIGGSDGDKVVVIVSSVSLRNKVWEKRAVFLENKTAISLDLDPVTRY